MRSTIRGLVSLCFLLLIQEANSQVYFNAKTITTAQGLSDNRVTCFYKDRKGFMWIGTRNGLNRYDGHSFKIFRPGPGNTISNEVINDIAEDSRGRIWVATMEGLNIYDPVSNKWECMLPDPLIKGVGIPNFIIWDILIDRTDKVWIAPDVFEFCSFDIATRKFTFYDWPSFARNQEVLKTYGYRSIQRFIPKSDHEFWLATTNGLVSLDISTQQFQFYGGGYNSDVFGLYYDNKSRQVFVSLEKGKLFRYSVTENKYGPVIPEVETYPSTYFSMPGKNELWMASEQGLIKLTDGRKKILLEKDINTLASSLLPGGVRAVLEDDQGIRWVGTMNGISIYDVQSNHSVFLPLLHASDKEGSNRMGGVYYDSVSNSYFVCALDPPSVFIINVSTGDIRKINTDASGKALSACGAIKAGRSNDLWLMTETDVLKYDRATGQFRNFPMSNKGVPVMFRDMLEDPAGNYWFSSFNKGLYFFNKTSQSFEWIEDSLFNDRGSITGLGITKKKDKLIVSTYGEGLYLYDLASRKKTVFHKVNDSHEWGPLLMVNTIARDSRGKSWLATNSGGIFSYDEEASPERSFTRHDMRSGLSNNNILSAASDDSTLWVLSGKGISALDLEGRFLYDLGGDKTFSFSTYGSDGRYSHEIDFAKERNELIVGVGGGLLIYSPWQPARTLHFPLTITSVKTLSDTIAWTASANASRYHLPYRSNAVSFEFAGLYYGAVQGIAYEYKLEGFDKEWMPAANSYSVSYQNLPSGNYLFRVRAKLPDGTIAGEITGFPFRIVPPFWRSAWFIGLLLLLIIAGIYWFIHSLKQKLEAERKISAFATSLYGQHTTDDIFWDTAKNCIEKLGFSDCVIYQLDEKKQVLVQKAAYGPKNPSQREILNIIEIPVGKGITGQAAVTGKPIIVRNTAKNPAYIVDDEKRLSEIAVPILVDNKVFAVIDSEHPKKNYYNRHHLRILKKVAEICSERILRHLTEEKLRAKIARDLHDEMGSTLTSINIISKVAIEEKQEPGKVENYFRKIKDHSARMMESMSDMVWAINPINDSVEKVIIRMKEFAAEMLEPARINYYFSGENRLADIQLNLEQRKNLYLVVKEAINNIVKYSEATEVSIVFQEHGEGMKMSITDNGNGFDAQKNYSGNGLRNMNTRAEEMGAGIRITSIPGAGTSIVLELAVT